MRVGIVNHAQHHSKKENKNKKNACVSSIPLPYTCPQGRINPDDCNTKRMRMYHTIIVVVIAATRPKQKTRTLHRSHTLHGNISLTL